MQKYYYTEVIDKFLNDNCYSKASFCRQAGISFNTLTKIYAQDKTVKILTMMKIANFMKVRTIDICNLKLKSEG